MLEWVLYEDSTVKWLTKITQNIPQLVRCNEFPCEQ
jgi:hypothetical protein